MSRCCRHGHFRKRSSSDVNGNAFSENSNEESGDLRGKTVVKGNSNEKSSDVHGKIVVNGNSNEESSDPHGKTVVNGNSIEESSNLQEKPAVRRNNKDKNSHHFLKTLVKGNNKDGLSRPRNRGDDNLQGGTLVADYYARTFQRRRAALTLTEANREKQRLKLSFNLKRGMVMRLLRSYLKGKRREKTESLFGQLMHYEFVG